MKRIQIAGLLLAGACAVSQADIQVMRQVSMESLGGLGGSDKQMTTWISSAKQREEKKSLGKPSVFEKMAGLDQPEITRLDKKVRWTLNPPRKTYEEISLIAPVVESKKEQRDESAEEKGGQAPEEKPTVKIRKAEFTVRALGEKKTVNQFACEGYEMLALIETEDLETHERNEMKMVTTLWTTPETGALAQLRKDEDAYAKAYAEMIGLRGTAANDMKMLGTSMVAAMAGAGEKELSGALSKAPQEMKKIKGYPIVTRVEWYGSKDGKDLSEEAAADAESAPEMDMSEMPSSVSDALGGLAAGFAKKKVKEKTAPKKGEKGKPQPLFSMTTEIKSISAAAIAPAVFEVPAGFKKVAH